MNKNFRIILAAALGVSVGVSAIKLTCEQSDAQADSTTMQLVAAWDSLPNMELDDLHTTAELSAALYPQFSVPEIQKFEEDLWKWGLKKSLDAVGPGPSPPDAPSRRSGILEIKFFLMNCFWRI